MSSETDLHPHQILCLDHKNTSLYGELIQIIHERNLYWLRPLALLQRSDQDPTIIENLYDLRQGADLLYPAFLFRAALDTELLPLLTQLENLKTDHPGGLSTHTGQIAHQQLQSFVREVWQVHFGASQ